MSKQVPLKRIKPRHDLLVFMHIRGKSNLEIADALDIHPNYVTLVLSDPAIKRMIEQLRGELRQGFVEGMEEQLMELGPQAIENLKTTLEATPTMNSRFKKHQDNMSIKLLDRIGFSPKRKDGGDREGGMRLDRDIQERMAKALETEDERDEYDSAVEAEWTEVDPETGTEVTQGKVLKDDDD